MARDESLNDRTPTPKPGTAGHGTTRRVTPWILWLVAASLSAIGLQRYRIDNDLASWFPELNAVGAVKSYAIVGFESNAFDDFEVAASLGNLPSVSFCLNEGYFEQTGQPPGFTPENFVVGNDGTYSGIFVFRNVRSDDETFVREIRAALGKLDQDQDRFALAGPAIFHVALNTFSQQRLSFIMLLINLMGGLWLWWMTGKLRAAFAGVAAIALSQIVLLGIVSWQRIPVDMSLSMVPPLIMALGYSYAAHRALRRSIAGTLLLCCVTTAAGIASVGISDLAPLRMFALYGTLGMGLVWLAVLTLLPEPSPRERSAGRRKRWLEPLLRCNLALVHRFGRTIVVVAVGITFASIFAIPKLRFETNPLAYFPSSSRVATDFKTIEARLTGTLPFQVTINGSGDPTEILESTTGVRKVLNVSSFVPGDASTYWGLAQSDALPELASAQATWRHWARANHVQLQWRGVAAQITATGEILRRVAVIALPIMGMVAALSIFVLTSSLWMAGVAVWVNLLPVAGLVLVIAVVRAPIGLPSLMIGAIAVGMAIDDTIHLVRAIQIHRGMSRGVMACWRPCVGSTLVAASCMACFAISPFLPTQQFGMLLGVTAVFALVVDILLLPVLCAGKLTRS
jgi:hypothetical protein